MIFGAKRPLLAIGNAQCSNPNESAVNHRADAVIELPVDGEQEQQDTVEERSGMTPKTITNAAPRDSNIRTSPWMIERSIACLMPSIR